jgi:hypothetical protein
MPDQPETPNKGKLFCYLFRDLPGLIIFVLLLIGFVTMKGGINPFLDRPGMTLCLGICMMVLGAYTAICAERVAREDQARRAKMAARFPWLAKLTMNKPRPENKSSGSLNRQIRFYRLAGLFMVLVGIGFYIEGWQQL